MKRIIKARLNLNRQVIELQVRTALPNGYTMLGRAGHLWPVSAAGLEVRARETLWPRLLSLRSSPERSALLGASPLRKSPWPYHYSIA
jgi:hypothetical protein